MAAGVAAGAAAAVVSRGLASIVSAGDCGAAGFAVIAGITGLAALPLPVSLLAFAGASLIGSDYRQGGMVFYLSRRIEPGGGFQQPDMTFLNEIGERQAIAPELEGQ